MSRSGALAGPWEHAPQPIFREDGGHGMVFEGPNGERLFTLHQPNSGGAERPRLFRVIERDGALSIEPWQSPETPQEATGTAK